MSKENKPRPCKSCGALIEFIPAENGKLIPVDAEARERVLVLLVKPSNGETIACWRNRAVSHFETCPNAAEHLLDYRTDTGAKSRSTR